MSATIDDFRNFFRPDKQRLAFSALSQIHQAVALVEASYAASRIHCKIEASADLQLVGFPNEFSQVILNLLTNARQAIQDAHTETGLITIQLDQAEACGRVRVCDNGGGVPPHFLDRIFEPYFSTKDAGTGIGLYMSRQIIEQSMSGHLRVRNINGGAEFTLLVPLAVGTA